MYHSILKVILIPLQSNVVEDVKLFKTIYGRKRHWTYWAGTNPIYPSVGGITGTRKTRQKVVEKGIKNDGSRRAKEKSEPPGGRRVRRSVYTVLQTPYFPFPPSL